MYKSVETKRKSWKMTIASKLINEKKSKRASKLSRTYGDGGYIVINRRGPTITGAGAVVRLSARRVESRTDSIAACHAGWRVIATRTNSRRIIPRITPARRWISFIAVVAVGSQCLTSLGAARGVLLRSGSISYIVSTILIVR